MLGEGHELGSDLDRLKQSADMLPERDGRGGNLLEEIQEEDLPDIELEDMDENTAQRDKGQLKTSTLEPSQNIS